jgi:nucleotide-binding universal stress UspA family protein
VDFVERRLTRIAHSLESGGVAVEWRVVEGRATRAILDAATSWRADLIAMATRKWSGIDRWLNDSIADEVVRSSEAPVLVVPPDWKPRQAGVQIARIIVPLDGSPRAESALRFAIALAESLETELILLRVVEAQSEHTANDYLASISAETRTALPGRTVETRVISGVPSDVVARSAETLDADLIVMSTRGTSGIQRAVLGSVATATLERSTVPLVLKAVPPPNRR